MQGAVVQFATGEFTNVVCGTRGTNRRNRRREKEKEDAENEKDATTGLRPTRFLLIRSLKMFIRSPGTARSNKVAPVKIDSSLPMHREEKEREKKRERANAE